MPVLTREQSREVDRIAMEELGIPGIVLMENAARGIAELARERLGGGAGPVAVVCGPGNNGGDGFAAARHLANAGVGVRLHLVVPPEAIRADSDAGINLRIATAMGLPRSRDLELGEAVLILDAIFGTGLTRDVRKPYRDAILAINRADADVLAIDVPSGLDADTGAVHGVAVEAALTATMTAPKAGFALAQGPAHVGDVRVVDIGVPPALVVRISAG